MELQFDLFDDDRNRILESSSYPEFKEALIRYDCRLCPLAGSRSRIVVDRGNPESEIMAISERSEKEKTHLGTS